MSRSFGEGSSSDHGGSSSSSKSSQIPVPLEGLSQPGPPPFLTKTYDIVETQSSNHIISWSSGNNSFVIWDPQTFALTLLPSYFKHNNFSSFVRQLNSYGFRKVDPERWEFANEGFLRGQRNLLSKIRRRGTSGTSPTPSILSQTSIDSCVEVGLFGSLDKEIDRLKRDKKMLMMELFKIREQHQSNRTYLESMEQRLRGTEMKQKQLMGFLARAVSNPNFMQQLIQQREVRKHNLLLQGSSDVSQMVTESDQYVNFQTPHQNPGMNMQSNSSTPDGKMPHMAGHEQERALDRLFWEEFLDENTEEDFSLMGAEGDEGQDVENLFDQFGDLG